MSVDIIVKSYDTTLHPNSEKNREYEDRIKRILSKLTPPSIIQEIEFYNFNFKRADYKIGSNQHLYIMSKYADKQSGEPYKTEEFNKTFQPLGTGKTFISNGIIIAEYIKVDNGANMLNIFVDLINDEHFVIFENLMKEFNEQIFEPLLYANSWSRTQDRVGLIKKLADRIEYQANQTNRENERRIQQFISEIESYKQTIKSHSTKLFNLMRAKKTEDDFSVTLKNNLMKDLDLILKLDTVKDVIVNDETYEVLTNPLKIYASNGHIYYGGKYKIVLKPSNSEVKFFGMENQSHNGLWTRHDAHPHVNGDTGNACLGNITSTIAELCAQGQIYALTLTCLDFLQSANVDDSAGSRIVNGWQEIDEQGNEIVVVRATWICGCCGKQYFEGDSKNHACDSADWDENNEEWDINNEYVICDDCSENEYYYEEDVDLYIHD